MGMFDYFHYNGEEYQTKSLDNSLFNYELREDGTLWRECFTIVLHNDTKAPLGFRTEHKDHYWKFEDEFDGAVYFYRGHLDDWIEYKALFMDGKLLKLEKLNEEV